MEAKVLAATGPAVYIEGTLLIPLQLREKWGTLEESSFFPREEHVRSTLVTHAAIERKMAVLP